ncbi:ep1-like glycoprotein 2 [Quercus suber]|uniref:Ep1-like glycoprotein 2 n=1 Tax=Quercus suber TaxID=58331 RepID=A0AAW0JTQ9_QUESU
MQQFSLCHFHSLLLQTALSANPKNPVGVNATLKLTLERGLVLQDTDGTIAWLTNISSKSVPSLNLTNMKNLMLLDENNATIWQSFDHPTTTLVVVQKLMAGQNLTSEEGLFLLSLTHEGLSAYINYNAPQCYFCYNTSYCKTGYVQFQNQSISFFEVDDDPSLGPKG